jgi:hypothetical protein
MIDSNSLQSQRTIVSGGNPKIKDSVASAASASIYYTVQGRAASMSGSRTVLVTRPLKFPAQFPRFQGDSKLELPSIEPHLPPGVDVDAVNSLTSVYRSHCLLALDTFRYCKHEKFCDSYKSLIGLLTVPGQKLLAHPSIAAWVKACDWLKYQKMIPMLDLILLTQVPSKAMQHMEYVARNLCGWVSQFFAHQPQHLQDAMLGPANVFSNILERFLRVNRAALDLSLCLNDEDRDTLWVDWINVVQPHRVLQDSLLGRGHARLMHILSQEVRFILNPTLNTSHLEQGIFVPTKNYTKFQIEEMALGKCSVVERLSRFLADLPNRFPAISARELVTMIEVVGNNISRNISMNGGRSLQTWWRLKVFIDEMSYWLAERGGFVQCGPETLTVKSQPVPNFYVNPASAEALNEFDVSASFPTTDANTQNSNTTSLNIAPDNSFLSSKDGHSTATHHHSLPVNKHQKADTNLIGMQHASPTSTIAEGNNEIMQLNDDSGIIMDDDFGIDTSKYHNFVDGGSDPADAVVR